LVSAAPPNSDVVVCGRRQHRAVGFADSLLWPAPIRGAPPGFLGPCLRARVEPGNGLVLRAISAWGGVSFSHARDAAARRLSGHVVRRALARAGGRLL